MLIDRFVESKHVKSLFYSYRMESVNKPLELRRKFTVVEVFLCIYDVLPFSYIFTVFIWSETSSFPSVLWMMLYRIHPDDVSPYWMINETFQIFNRLIGIVA